MANAPITFGGGAGSGSDDCTATRNQLLAGYTGILRDSDDEPVNGNIQTKAAATYNPSTSQQVITGGQYLGGNQTIAPVTGTAAAGDVLVGKTFSSGSGINQTGTLRYYDYS